MDKKKKTNSFYIKRDGGGARRKKKSPVCSGGCTHAHRCIPPSAHRPAASWAIQCGVAVLASATTSPPPGNGKENKKQTNRSRQHSQTILPVTTTACARTTPNPTAVAVHIRALRVFHAVGPQGPRRSLSDCLLARASAMILSLSLV